MYVFTDFFAITYTYISSRQKQGTRIEAVRRSRYWYFDHSDRNAPGGHYVHFL